MDDLNERLAEILNDPESLNRVRAMAENLLGKSDQSASESTASTPTADIGSLFGGGNIDPIQIGKILSIMSQLKSHNNDSRSNLLLALKPLLSTPKREKVDTAIKLLKIIDLLPLIKDSGIFNF